MVILQFSGQSLGAIEGEYALGIAQPIVEEPAARGPQRSLLQQAAGVVVIGLRLAENILVEQLATQQAGAILHGQGLVPDRAGLLLDLACAEIGPGQFLPLLLAPGEPRVLRVEFVVRLFTRNAPHLRVLTQLRNVLVFDDVAGSRLHLARPGLARFVVHAPSPPPGYGGDHAVQAVENLLPQHGAPDTDTGRQVVAAVHGIIAVHH
ncbi:hypothetical protein D3C81_1051310 [compost metagenome]